MATHQSFCCFMNTDTHTHMKPRGGGEGVSVQTDLGLGEGISSELLRDPQGLEQPEVPAALGVRVSVCKRRSPACPVPSDRCLHLRLFPHLETALPTLVLAVGLPWGWPGAS